MKKPKIHLALLAFAIALFTSCQSGNQSNSVSTDTEFDLVILNGRVMDPETNFDGIRNVGIKDGVIALITEEKISGKETIDASGQVVAPGFIDTHNHWQRTMGYKIALRDGVTSSFDLEYGTVGNRVAEWYAEREGKTQMNYGTASSHEAARSAVLDQCPEAYDAPTALSCRANFQGWSDTIPSIEEGNEILKVIDQGLADGAIGIAATLGYFRNGATAREVFEVQKVGARYGRQYGAHNRYTVGNSTTEPNGAQEIIANGLALGAPVLVCHYNNAGWSTIHEIILGLQSRGFNVWGEIYPYTAGQTNAGAVFLQPAIFETQLGYKYEESISDPVNGKFFTREEFLNTAKNDPGKEILFYKQPEENVEKWLRLEGVSLANDALMALDHDAPWETPYEKLEGMHPRTPGARGLALRYSRERNIPLMAILNQLSYVSAKHLGDMGLEDMQKRGRIQEGMVADIVIFDPNTVTDNATYAVAWKPTTGMKAVLVNGTVVVKDDEVLPVFPGQAIRFKPTESKFQPVSKDQWVERFMVGVEIEGDGCLPTPETHPEHFKK
ncbi:MAG: hydrolase [Cytophagales bacterium]|nr:MAG: hydrolase [Cytophagales bacterium]